MNSTSEADVVKKYLKIESIHYKNGNWDKKEQLQKNQPAIKLLKERIEKHKSMSEEESKQRAEFFADFQKTIDADRSIRKLYEA
jgi:coenzyme F420-reducing hydrogenase delta subunit